MKTRNIIIAIMAGFILPAIADTAELERRIVSRYAELVENVYRDTLSKAKDLEKSVNTFLEQPSAEGLEATKTAWIEARKPYLQTEAFRFYEGPIDDVDGPEGLLNAWPMDEAYLDYVKGNAEAGLINRAEQYPNITKELIASLNERDGEENISSGYHAIEFLLWGQDLSSDGPGQRPFTDYTTAKNASRRAAALGETTALLVQHLQGLLDEWKESGTYRKQFVSAPSRQSLKSILTGISMLSGFEMASERLAVAYDTQEQEDEHSCFSDTTHIDIVYDLMGIENVWFGSYKGKRGASLHDLALIIDSDLAVNLEKAVRRSVEKGKAIPAPFDQAILGDDSAPGRKAILSTMESLEEQAELLLSFSQKLGFEVPISE